MEKSMINKDQCLRKVLEVWMYSKYSTMILFQILARIQYDEYLMIILCYKIVNI